MDDVSVRLTLPGDIDRELFENADFRKLNNIACQTHLMGWMTFRGLTARVCECICV